MSGLYYEQFEVGRTFDHEIRRTVMEGDNVWFCAATCNPARIHIDAEYCARTEFKKPLINSIFTLGLVIGLSTGVGLILGLVAWILGNSDLREMQAGRMDREGEGMTQGGRICGMIATILAIVSTVIGLLILLLYFGCCCAAMGGAGAGGG